MVHSVHELRACSWCKHKAGTGTCIKWTRHDEQQRWQESNNRLETSLSSLPSIVWKQKTVQICRSHAFNSNQNRSISVAHYAHSTLLCRFVFDFILFAIRGALNTNVLNPPSTNCTDARIMLFFFLLLFLFQDRLGNRIRAHCTNTYYSCHCKTNMNIAETIF